MQFQRNMPSNIISNIISPAESTGVRVVLLLSCRHDPSLALALKALIALCSTVLDFFLCGPQWLSWESTHNSRMTPD